MHQIVYYQQPALMMLEENLREEMGNASSKIKQIIRVGRLYLLNGRAQLLGQERTNYVAIPKLSWDQWHRCFRHISISALEHLDQENMVDGLFIDQSLIASKSCDACIQAKQAWKSYPQEAKH